MIMMIIGKCMLLMKMMRWQIRVMIGIEYEMEGEDEDKKMTGRT